MRPLTEEEAYLLGLRNHKFEPSPEAEWLEDVAIEMAKAGLVHHDVVPTECGHIDRYLATDRGRLALRVHAAFKTGVAE